MRVPINLASHPQDTSVPLRRSAIALGLLALVLGFLSLRAELRSREEFRSLVDQSSQLEADIQNLEHTQNEMQDWLETPQVTQIRNRSALLNALIEQKSLSWTRMFQDLERTLPGGVRITGIVPDASQDGAVQGQPNLRMGVAATSITPIVDFIKRLEDSAEFDYPVVVDQRYGADSGEQTEITVSLETRYMQTLSGDAGDTASESQEQVRPAAADQAEADEIPEMPAGTVAASQQTRSTKEARR